MSAADLLRGTGDWLLVRIDPRTALKLRKELRRLQRDLDAIFVGLWVSTTRGDVLVEYAGEHAIAPESCPFIASTVPSFETVRGADGDDYAAVLHRPRLGRDMPRLSLLAMMNDDAAAFDVVEEAGERLEAILVEALPA